MVLHMFAIFDRETAKPPSGIESLVSQSRPHHAPDELEVAKSEELCRSALERVFSKEMPSSRQLDICGHGTGFTFESTPYCSYATREGVHVLFAGEVGEWPGIDAVSVAHDAFIRNIPPPEENDAHWLLDFYDSFKDCEARDATETALDCLAQVRGSFAFIIYDEIQKRVFAARDAQGGQPLYWGATDEGHLMFGSVLEDLEGCNPTATMFPAGTLFASERHTVAYHPGRYGWVIAGEDLPGQLFSFLKMGEAWRDVKVIPRITSKGVMCGAVYKVASVPELPAMPPAGPTETV